MTGLPRWMELEVEIGMARERLRQIQQESSSGSALGHAIDDATGRTEAWLAEARELAEAELEGFYGAMDAGF